MAGDLKKPDARFRSFAERFLVTRSHLFKQETLAEETWSCVQDAMRAYKMIRLVSMNHFEDHMPDEAQF